MVCCFFFFQAEDGIRDYKVTGVQTCALPISRAAARGVPLRARRRGAGAAARPWARALPAGRGRPRVVASTRALDAGEVGRGACRGRGEISVGGGSFKKKKKK